MASATRNTLLMLSASVGQKLVSFFYFTLIARSIGVENTGKYFFALSFTTVFVVFVDLGLNGVLIREGAKYKEKIQDFLSNVLFAKFILGILSYLAVILVINLMGYGVDIKSLVYILAITMLFDSLQLSIFGTLRALGKLKYEAFAIVVSQTLTFVLGSLFLYKGLPLIYLMYAFLIPSVLNSFYASFVLYKNYNINIIPKYEKEILFTFIKIAVPFALASVFARIYSYADSLILSKLAGDVAVGLYSIPYKITYAFQFIPLAFMAALYPKFSEYFVHDKRKLSKVFEKSLRYLLIIVAPVSIGIAVLAKDIVLFLYTEQFLNSVLPLQILIISLLFSFLSFPVGAFLNATGKQVVQTKIVGFVMIANIFLNLILIPKIGVVGAAIAALVGNILLTVLGYAFVPQIIKINHKKLIELFLKTLFSVGLMGIFVWWSNLYINFFISIFVGAIIYTILIFAVRVLTIRQLREAYLLVRRR